MMAASQHAVLPASCLRYAPSYLEVRAYCAAFSNLGVLGLGLLELLD